MNRRTVLRVLGSAGVVGAIPGVFETRIRAHAWMHYKVYGSGPTLMAFDSTPKGYFDHFTNRYRVIVIDDRPTDTTQAFEDSYTADGLCADILALADEVGADRFAWYGFSFGGVVGLQLACRTNRLTALVCGGWPPLDAQYRETLAVTEIEAAQGRAKLARSFYRSIANWAERDAVSKLTCPRMTFAGTKDAFVTAGYQIHIGSSIAEHREELERLGWTVRLVEGFGHELGAKPDVVTPLIREFLDPLLLRGIPLDETLRRR